MSESDDKDAEELGVLLRGLKSLGFGLQIMCSEAFSFNHEDNIRKLCVEYLSESVTLLDKLRQSAVDTSLLH
ncbi:MAG: hypothetical protein ACREBG_01830 [Pyrinomonadaceae bacterium]